MPDVIVQDRVLDELTRGGTVLAWASTAPNARSVLDGLMARARARRLDVRLYAGFGELRSRAGGRVLVLAQSASRGDKLTPTLELTLAP